ncbi:MAG: hypothetical protein M0Z91_03320 [Actinomycetota bacterium]|nr:hypothetical protein [Actinomycetota bacterium]
MKRLTPTGARVHARALLASLLLVPVLSACAGASAGLGTSSEACFTALPSAYKAVGSRAKLLGVRLLAAGKVGKVVEGLPAGDGRTLCLLAFELPDSKGEYRVVRRDDQVFGDFKLVAYSLQEKKVLKVRARRSLPMRFAHEISIV